MQNCSLTLSPPLGFSTFDLHRPRPFLDTSVYYNRLKTCKKGFSDTKKNMEQDNFGVSLCIPGDRRVLGQLSVSPAIHDMQIFVLN